MSFPAWASPGRDNHGRDVWSESSSLLPSRDCCRHSPDARAASRRPTHGDLAARPALRAGVAARDAAFRPDKEHRSALAPIKCQRPHRPSLSHNFSNRAPFDTDTQSSSDWSEVRRIVAGAGWANDVHRQAEGPRHRIRPPAPAPPGSRCFVPCSRYRVGKEFPATRLVGHRHRMPPPQMRGWMVSCEAAALTSIYSAYAPIPLVVTEHGSPAHKPQRTLPICSIPLKLMTRYPRRSIGVSVLPFRRPQTNSR